MLFDVYGDTAVYQWIGWAMVLIALILLNEFARRSKAGGILCFIVVPSILTVYFIAITVCAAMGQEWALNNPTYLYQGSWFHYAKLYAATIGCIGFMALKYQWGSIGKSHWFKCFPFVIVAINILCMTGWFGIYISKKRQDMLWPDMTWVFIIAYDIWNFCYTYNCLPTHSWYCGLALLLAPTIAAFAWNKGVWIQNRAFTLSIWCMFCQVCPMFANDSIFAVQSVNNPDVNLAVSVVALVANVLALGYIVYRSKKLGVNPYMKEVFVGTKDYEKAMKRRASDEELATA